VDRRVFLRTSAAAAAAPGAGVAQQPSPGIVRRKGAIKLGHKHDHTDATLKVMAAFGVTHICSSVISRRLDESWSAESLTKLRERVGSYGIKLEMLALPMSSVAVESAENPNILLGKDPERDREIDNICQIIRNCAKAGIPSAKYAMTVLGVIRTESVRGRGGAMYSAFDYRTAKPDAPLTAAGEVSAEVSWERVAYFVKRVVPVAEEYKIRLALHPQDPAMPPGQAFRGVHRVLATVDGLKRYIELSPSAYHGLLFCQGTLAESMKNPAKEILEAIRYFGGRGKLFGVEFRNIRGGFLNFQETFPDDGDINMLEALRVYREVGYDGMILPDHVPRIEGDQGSRQAFAFAWGYIKSLMDLVNNEA
jgi:mannonate dehydratase